VTNASGGAAISGATVKDSGGASATTNGSGAYTLAGLTSGNHTLTASASGASPQALTAGVSGGQTTPNVNFRLSSTAGSVSGKVSNASGGAAIAGATISDSGGASTTADAAGLYTLSGLPAGTRTLTASAIGFNPQTLTATVTAGQTTANVNFSLAAAPGAVTGMVTNSTGGAPIAGATVSDSG